MSTMSRTKAAVGAGALVLAGVGGGAAIMLASSASADDQAGDIGSVVAAYGLPGERGEGDRPQEEPLTGSALNRVTAAVEEAYPNAEIERAETDSEGVYEAHIVTGAGERLIVQLDEDFTITGTQAGGGPGGRGGPGECDEDDEGDEDDTASEAPAA